MSEKNQPPSNADIEVDHSADSTWIKLVRKNWHREKVCEIDQLVVDGATHASARKEPFLQEVFCCGADGPVRIGEISRLLPDCGSDGVGILLKL